MDYETVSQEDVYKKLVSVALSLFNPIGGAINIVNIAYLLNTSKYQVKKHVGALKKQGIVELKCINNWDEEENHPPYWGYVLTAKGRETDYFKAEDKKEAELIQKCFR